MKRIVGLIGIGLLCAPILRHLGFRRRIESATTADEVVSSLGGVFAGLVIGFIGLMVLGFVVDGGSGYRKPMLLVPTAMLGLLWLALYPSGWMLGVPLVLYSLLRKLGFGNQITENNKK